MTAPDVHRAGNGSGKITREAVLAAALEIIDRDGADALSMRRLARALGRDPMIVYRRASGKAALLDGVAETVVARPAAGGRLPFPRAGAGPPARRAADRHPVAGHPPAGCARLPAAVKAGDDAVGAALGQRVEVSDDDRTVATAEVTTSEGSGGTARVPLRAGPGTSRQGAARAWSMLCWIFPRCRKRTPGGGIPVWRWRVTAPASGALRGCQYPPSWVERALGCEPSVSRAVKSSPALSRQ
ncbi:MAG TPA: TetR family transcriptional regulator [Streptosporangiaceae bacterium]|jgi:AcrR family transcriptional regulator|nr:TetR family transcriptional regulator [Streptosporangiaceae bacterium]